MAQPDPAQNAQAQAQADLQHRLDIDREEQAGKPLSAPDAQFKQQYDQNLIHPPSALDGTANLSQVFEKVAMQFVTALLSDLGLQGPGAAAPATNPPSAAPSPAKP